MAGHVLAGLVRNETPEALAHDYVERLAVFGLGVCCPTPAADSNLQDRFWRDSNGGEGNQRNTLLSEWFQRKRFQDGPFRSHWHSDDVG